MTIQLNGKPSMAGHFHIHQPVDMTKLLEVVHGLVQDQSKDLSRLKDFHVRRGGDDGSYIVAFHYVMSNGSTEEFQGISELVRETLKQRLKLKPKQMNWSIGSVLVTI